MRGQRASAVCGATLCLSGRPQVCRGVHSGGSPRGPARAVPPYPGSDPDPRDRDGGVGDRSNARFLDIIRAERADSFLPRGAELVVCPGGNRDAENGRDASDEDAGDGPHGGTK